MFSKKPADAPFAPAPTRPSKTMGSNSSTFSVIGADVVITGDVKASADLHVDGTIRGDLECAALVQGEAGTIEGAIVAETARLAGTVRGSVRARELTVQRSAVIEGDVNYEALTIEQGARVEGQLGQIGHETRKASRPADHSAAPKTDSAEDAQRLSLAG